MNACEKSIATIHAIENEQKARDKDWTEAKALKEKLQDPEVDQKMEDLIQLQSKMIDVNQKQLTNLQIGEFLVEIISFCSFPIQKMAILSKKSTLARIYIKIMFRNKEFFEKIGIDFRSKPTFFEKKMLFFNVF